MTGGTTINRRGLEPLIATILRPLVYMVAAGALAGPLVVGRVAVVIALAAGVGAVLGRALARGRLRLPPLTAVLTVGVVLVALGRHAMLGSAALAAWLGPATSVAVTNMVCLGLAAALCASGIRCAALRHRGFSAIEVGLVGLAFAQLVAAHRHGAINRPFALADSIIAGGGDPTLALLGTGCVAAAFIVLLLINERHWLRASVAFAVALSLLSLVVISTRVLGLPGPPQSQSGLGLRPGEGKGDKSKQSHQGQGGGRSTETDNEELQFRDNYDTSGQQVPLAVVLLHDDYSPPGGSYYFRQTAFSQYNGRRLVTATRSDADDDVPGAFVGRKTQISEVPNERGERKELETTVALLADHRRPFALESMQTLEPLQNPDPGRFRRVYRAGSFALNTSYDQLLGRRPGDPDWNEEQFLHYTQAPDDPRYLQLAEQILSKLPPALVNDPMARAYQVSLWLGKEGIYSLKSGHAKAQDPTASFLFGDKTGYCVHFSHAAVYMLRAVGLPARVGAGYVVDEASRQGGSSILVTGANSHAWPEVYVDGLGWVIVDIAVERALDPPPPHPDPDLQRLLGEMARGLDPLPQSDARPFDPAIAAAKRVGFWVGFGGAILLAVLLALSFATKLWRQVAPWMVSPEALPRVVYRAELDRLSGVSMIRRFGESRERFADRIAPRVPSFLALTRSHVAAAFADQPQLDVRRVQQDAAAVRSELRNAVPWWRRILGLMNPFSWLRSR